MCSIEERNNINIIDPDEENQINNQLEEQQKLMQANNLNRINSPPLSLPPPSPPPPKGKKAGLDLTNLGPKTKYYLKVGAVALITAGTAPIVIPAAVGAIGFGAGGIAAGSMAASMMSFFGGAATQAGSIVAICQSIGATGTIAASTSVAAGGAVGGAGLGWKWWKGSGEDKGGNEGQPPPKDPANEKKESVEEEINNVNEEEEEDKNVLFDVQNNTNHTRKL